MRLLTTTLALSAFAGLSACGGGGGTVAPGGGGAPTSAQFAAILDDDRAEVSRIAGSGTGIPTTASANVPVTAGTTQFSGVGIIGINVAGNDGVLIRGNANVDVEFQNNSLTGSISNLVAVDSRNTIPVLVGETVALTNGAINPALRNAFTLGYTGTLDVDGTDYALDGTMNGQFRGTAAAALSASDDTGLANTNLATTIAVVAEQ